MNYVFYVVKNKMKHYTENLSAYLHDELAQGERQIVAEHLSSCALCRKEFEEIKLGAAFAARLKQADAPPNLWNKIENRLDEKQKNFSLFNSPIFVPAAFAVLFAVGISFLVYSIFWRNDVKELSENKSPIETKKSNEWNVETISGILKTDSETITGKGVLTVGETLETDENSRARVEVADIGQVEIAPNSRVQFVNTSKNEHRLSLEKGVLQATILAPPRLFIVDTPSAVAVDLGCAYTLEVDDNGDSKLHVTSGFVALERDGRESIVPAGAMAITKKGKGLGTPFAEDASAEYRDALYEFDFKNGGEKSLEIVLKNPNIKTSLTLWHLLSRVPESEREKVFDKLVFVVKLPEGVTRKGILNLDKEMLTVWRLTIEGKWFEDFYGSKMS